MSPWTKTLIMTVISIACLMAAAMLFLMVLTSPHVPFLANAWLIVMGIIFAWVGVRMMNKYW